LVGFSSTESRHVTPLTLPATGAGNTKKKKSQSPPGHAREVTTDSVDLGGSTDRVGEAPRDSVRGGMDEGESQDGDPEVSERLVQRLAHIISARLGFSPSEAPPSYSPGDD